MYKAKPKLVIETSETTDAALEWLVANELGEGGTTLNKTTLINRAVQMYAELVHAHCEGNEIYIGQVQVSTLTWG